MKTPSVKAYVLTWAALLALAALTTLVGLLNLGPLTMVIAIAIATAKAVIIAAVFMNGLFEGKLVKVAIAASVLWFLIMVILTGNDYFTRGWVPFPGK
jgi:cytochrome c oxidase subunit IV